MTALELTLILAITGLLIALVVGITIIGAREKLQQARMRKMQRKIAAYDIYLRASQEHMMSLSDHKKGASNRRDLTRRTMLSAIAGLM